MLNRSVFHISYSILYDLCANLFILTQEAVTFTEPAADPAERYRHHYERIKPGTPSSHNEETCVYCLHRAEQIPARRAARLAEVEAAFVEAGLGREDMDVDMDDDDDDDDETDADSDMEEDEGEEWEATIEEGPCNGILDVVFTGVTEERHGDAWCHYMYYGRLREWDGLIVLVGVPVSTSSVLLH